jgi:hypothetical protein
MSNSSDGNNTIWLTAAQYAQDNGVFTHITNNGSVNLGIYGASAAEASLLSQMNTSGNVHINQIVVTDTHDHIQQVQNTGGMSGNVTYEYTDGLQIIDSVNHFVSNISQYDSQVQAGNVSSIQFTDNLTIVDLTGNQIINGTSGNDVFVVSSPNSYADVNQSIDTLYNFADNDVIQYSRLLKIGANGAVATPGSAHIDARNGLANFASDNESLNQQIADVEAALSQSGAPTAGTVVKWDGSGADANNSFVLITGNHTSPTDTSHDQVIKIVGVDASHVQVAAGVVVHHT